jgi:Ca2+-binding RTX toxin-like protein
MCGGHVVTISADEQGDKVVGTEGDDVICTGSDADVIDGGAGSDQIEAYGGNDRIDGGRGSDWCARATDLGRPG